MHKNNKFRQHCGRLFTTLLLLVTGLCFSHFLSGCSGSEEEPEMTKRQTDSILTYSEMQKVFGLYKKGLELNEAGNPGEAAKNFEASLKKLKGMNTFVINDPLYYNWKKDYDELATGIVQDYLASQSEIDKSSLVFEFASKIPVQYERVERVEVQSQELPEGIDVPLIRNSVVDEYIEFFSNTDRGRSFIDKCMYRGGRYFPLMRSILKANDAPEELIYLSVQESGLNPTIVSRAGAVGLWQFMPATGAAYDLYQDYYRDDRRDFEKATESAARHLKDLYRTFDDWYLAFAAYNAGPGRVRKAISRSGSRDFWVLRSYLPGETKNYVPSIIALSFVMRDPEAYGFDDLEMGEPIKFDRVEVTASMSLQRVAELCGTDIETIRDLNPELMNDELPMYDVPYHLRIPFNSYNTFATNYKNASDIQKGSGDPEFAGNELGGIQGLADIGYKVKDYEVSERRYVGSTREKVKVQHDLLASQNLLWLSSYYDVRPVDIRLWNNMNYGSVFYPNQRLSIYLSKDKYDKLYGQNGSEPKELADAEEISSEPVAVAKEETTTDEGNDAATEYIPEPPQQIADYYKSEDSKNDEQSSENSSEEVSTVVEEVPSTETTVSTTPETQSTETVVEQVEETPSETETEAYEYVEYVPETNTKVNNTSEGTFSTYTVKQGDNLTAIAESHNTSVSDLRELNGIDGDKIMVGQKLKIRSAPSTHTVASGENLTMIAGRYGVSVSKLMELNDLSNDVIVPGQKLVISGDAVVSTKKTSASDAKTHKVKSGETLADISSKYGISISQLMRINNLKSDKILVGQVLKVSNDSGTKKVRKKK